MATWALMKLLHPFTADDLLVSRRILSSLELPPATAQFVLALPHPAAPENTVYFVAVEKLSERSAEDVEVLVAAVKPNSVVALVDEGEVFEIWEESELLDSESPEALSLPGSIFDVVKTSFLEKIKADGFEYRAGVRVLRNLFGTSFHGNALAARSAAQNAHAEFEYLAFPTTATHLLTDVDDDDEDDEDEDTLHHGKDSNLHHWKSGGGPSLGSAERFLARFSAFVGDNEDYHGRYTIHSNNCSKKSVNVERQTLSLSPRVPTLQGSSLGSEGLKRFAPSTTAALANQVKGSPFLPADASEDIPEEKADVNEIQWPTFSAPFSSLFLDLHELFRETPGVEQALHSVQKLLNSVDCGEEVDPEDLSRARLFRAAVESVRVCWKSFIRSDRRRPVSASEFSFLPFEEKCQALLAHALQHQAQKFQTVVAVVDASSVPGIRRHWNTSIPEDVAEYTEFCFVGANVDESREDGGFRILEIPETKAAVAVSAGAVTAASLVTLPQWVSVPTFMKVVSVKIPTVLKLAWLQLKRQATYGLASSLTSASKIVTPIFKGVASGKAIVTPTSASKAVLLKSASAEKARAAAQSVVAMAERASLQAIRTAFYSLMRSRQANLLGPRRWAVLGSSVAVGCGVLWYGDEMEHAISAIPFSPSVVRLSRGLDSLEEASKAVSKSEDASWWDEVYSSVYRSTQQF